MAKLTLLSGILFLSALAPANAGTYYVATTGKDTNPGTLAAPWKTIQKAADSLSGGDTVYVRRGLYRSRINIHISGSAEAGPIVFANYPGEAPVIDALGLVPPESETGIFFIADQSYVTIRGFDLRNYLTTSSARTPSGIFVTGNSHHIELRNNKIHAIRNAHRDGNAFGIAIYGTSATAAIHHLIIDANNIHHNKTGNSESLALNGNVTDFEVTRNLVHHNNNIGIVFIGYEGTCPDEAFDQARDGICRDNRVYNNSSIGNLSYGGEMSSDGIYCDGSTRILVERNTVFSNDIGVELASEHGGKKTSFITLRNNLIWGNRITGISLGGYDSDRGSTEDCLIRNNTLYRNDTRGDGNGEILLQFYVRNNQLSNNVIAAGPQGLLIGDQTATGSNNSWDYNLYFGPADSEWEFQGDSKSTLAHWRSASAQDAHSLFANPYFLNPTLRKFSLRQISPAINAGAPNLAPDSDELDLGLTPRLDGPFLDLGAFEFHSPL